MTKPNLRVLIVAEHASLKFGGEAALPLHYFRLLRKRGIETWLIVHSRTRDELKSFFPQDFDRIYFVTDTFWHCIIWQCGKLLPNRLSHFTFGLILRLITQILQRRIAKQVAIEQKIDIIHQPILVSPKEPSMIFDVGAPVIIGPMNGGMKIPPAFQKLEGSFVDMSLRLGRISANLINRLIPGKCKAATLLVANDRTRDALPKCISGKVIELVENGVDLSIWQSNLQNKTSDIDTTENHESLPNARQITKFVYVGRLVAWKAVNLLLIAFKRVVEKVPAVLEIIGDGIEQANLEAQAKELGLTKNQYPYSEEKTQQFGSQTQESNSVCFMGMLSQIDCAQRLHLADVLVFPSLYECGGAAVLEAMAMGLPVIATNWGGPADYLDESCGILVEPASQDSFIDDLTTAMIKLAKSSALRQEMGKAGHQKVIDHFDWEMKVDIMVEIYQEAIARTESKSAPMTVDS
jgi:glycosyltransferase involved in cell wall biosynthesis